MSLAVPLKYMRGEQLTTILLDMIQRSAPWTVGNNELGGRGVVEVGGEREAFIQGCERRKGWNSASNSARHPHSHAQTVSRDSCVPRSSMKSSAWRLQLLHTFTP